MQVYEKPRQRKQWQASDTPPDMSPRAGSPASGPAVAGAGGSGVAIASARQDSSCAKGGDLTPEARRAVSVAWAVVGAGAGAGRPLLRRALQWVWRGMWWECMG